MRKAPCRRLYLTLYGTNDQRLACQASLAIGVRVFESCSYFRGLPGAVLVLYRPSKVFMGIVVANLVGGARGLI